MTAGGAPTPLRARRPQEDADAQDVPAYCARPACGNEYRRLIQPGRPQLYCGEPCRRRAEQEVRRIKSRLRDLEATVTQHRTLLAAYGSEAGGGQAPEAALAKAATALHRADGVLRFLPAIGDPTVDEFRALWAAVAPLTRDA